MRILSKLAAESCVEKQLPASEKGCVVIGQFHAKRLSMLSNKAEVSAFGQINEAAAVALLMREAAVA